LRDSTGQNASSIYIYSKLSASKTEIQYAVNKQTHTYTNTNKHTQTQTQVTQSESTVPTEFQIMKLDPNNVTLTTKSKIPAFAKQKKLSPPEEEGKLTNKHKTNKQQTNK